MADMHIEEVEAEFERVHRHWTRWVPKGVLRAAGLRRLPGPQFVEVGHSGSSVREVVVMVAVAVVLAAGTVIAVFLV